jgi:hypothetical protein
MKMLSNSLAKFTLNIAGGPITPGVACPPHATLDDLRTARQAQQDEQRAASKRAFGDVASAQDVQEKIEPKPAAQQSLTEQLAADGDVRRTRKRSGTTRPRTNGKKQ